MVAGVRTDGGNHQRQTTYQVRKIIQSLREIVGNHSDADIYAVLKESNMDPNETAQKLLNQDPFHVVQRRRDKKKELTGFRGFNDTRRRVEHNIQPARPPATWPRNIRRGEYHRNTLPDAGLNREVRIIKEYRVKQNANRYVMPESVKNSASVEEQAKFDLLNTSSTGVCADQNEVAASNAEGLIPSQSVSQPCDSAPDHAEVAGPTSTYTPLLEKIQATTSTLNSEAQREGQENPRAFSGSALSNSVVGVYSSASDPVHVPSPASRSAGAVGAIRREVGVVGVRKQSSHQPATNSAISDSSFSVPLLAKDTSSAESLGQSGGIPNQVVASDPVTTSRASSGSQHNIKIHQQPAAQQKVMQSTMEWKPKSSQKTTIISPIISSSLASSCADSASSSNPVDVSNLSEKLSHVSILEERHVIIPQHLRVPESEYTQLAFGSFGVGFDSTKGFSSACEAFENADQLSDEPSLSLSASVPVSSSGNTSADDQVDLSACQATSSRSDSPVSDVEPAQSSSGNSESLNRQNIENYADIGLVQSHSPPYSSPQTQQLQTPNSLPSFSAYDPRTSYDVPFLRTVMEDNVHGQGLASSAEGASLHATNSSLLSTLAFPQQQQSMMQQQQQQQQQSMMQQQQQQSLMQQPVTNLYPQVHFSHFPNFVPYRHVFSPVYLPQMAMTNYSNNPAYPHPSNGSSYLLMPGGSSHVPGGGMKYAGSQYKPVPGGTPTGYGNYTNPTTFTINTPGSNGGATGLEDVSRIKYKDNNLYVPNPQAETSDIWIQTPREPNLQANPYYNLSGQPPHAAAAAAFLPAAHAGHASFNAAAAQSPHVHYPGLYQPSPSPASLTAPHHLVHQAGLGGSIGGVGLAAAAPGPQIGAYQQTQLSHVNWPANF